MVFLLYLPRQDLLGPEVSDRMTLAGHLVWALCLHLRRLEFEAGYLVYSMFAQVLGVPTLPLT